MTLRLRRRYARRRWVQQVQLCRIDAKHRPALASCSPRRCLKNAYLHTVCGLLCLCVYACACVRVYACACVCVAVEVTQSLLLGMLAVLLVGTDKGLELQLDSVIGRGADNAVVFKGEKGKSELEVP